MRSPSIALRAAVCAFVPLAVASGQQRAQAPAPPSSDLLRAEQSSDPRAAVQARGKEIEFGVVRQGMLADLMIVDQNPLENLKVLYASGALRLNDTTGKPEWIGGVKWTIKDGIVFDAKQLAADVAQMVEDQRRTRPVGVGITP